jgi:4-amino-4-deoxy-L-arabinose transferase-like glycosyltransferase
MGRAQAEVRPKVTAAVGDMRWWIRRIDWFLLLRRGLLLLALVDVAVAEAQLSKLVKGGGADKVAASPQLVTLLLCASLGAAVLLRWQSVCAGVMAAWWGLARFPEWLRAFPDSVRATVARLKSPRRGIAALLARWRSALYAVTWRHWISLALAWLALVATLLALLVVGNWPTGPQIAQWFWIAATAFMVLAAVVWPTRRPYAHLIQHERLAREILAGLFSSWRAIWRAWGDWLLLVPLLSLGVALRLPNLANLPYVVHGDEASCALEALRWLHGEVTTLLSTGWYGLPELGFGIPALVMRFAGDGLFGLRLSSVIVGLLSLALLYLLAREFAGRRVAFLATALLTVSHLHLQYSRSGIHYIHALFAVELTLWLLVRALRNRSPVAAVLTAVAIAFSAQVYFSARIVFVIVPLFIAGLLLFNRRLLAGRLPTLGWLLAGLVVTLGPLVAFFKTSGALNSRTNEVLILNQTPWMRAHLIEQFGTADPVKVLLRQLAAVPLIPTGLADQSTQYGPHYSLLDIGMATLVTIGFFYALLRLREPVYLLLFLWMTSTIIFGGILTIDMPGWQRLLVMLPALCLLAALLLDDLLRRVEWAIGGVARWLGAIHLPNLLSLAPIAATTVLALALVGLSANWNMQRYFDDYPHQTNTDPWWTTYTDIGRYLGTMPAGTHFILFSDDSLIADYATLRYLGAGASGTRVETADDLVKALANADGPIVVIVTLSRVASAEAAIVDKGILPPGTFTPYVTANHTTTFYLFMPSSPPAGGATSAP